MKELKRLFRRLLPHLETLARVGLLYFFFRTAKGIEIVEKILQKILPYVPGHEFVWPFFSLTLIVAVWIVVLYVQEGRLLGDVRKQPFRMEPGETLVFSSRWVGGLLFLRAKDHDPRARIRDVMSEKKRLLGRPNLMLWLTDRRLMLCSWAKETWRIIPISSIGRVTEAPRRFFFSPDRVVIGYHHEGRSEVLVIEDKSLMGRTLKEALLALNLFTPGPSSPLSAGLPSKIAGS